MSTVLDVVGLQWLWDIQDRHVEVSGIQTSREKSGLEKGCYIHALCIWYFQNYALHNSSVKPYMKALAGGTGLELSNGGQPELWKELRPISRWRMVSSGWAQDSQSTTLLPHHQPIRRKPCTLQLSPQILPIKLLPKTTGIVSTSHLFSLLAPVANLPQRQDSKEWKSTSKQRLKSFIKVPKVFREMRKRKANLIIKDEHFKDVDISSSWVIK